MTNHIGARYFPSDAFASGHVERAVAFLEGDQTGGHKIPAGYGKHTPASKIEQANLEQRRDGGLAYVLVGISLYRSVIAVAQDLDGDHSIHDSLHANPQRLRSRFAVALAPEKSA